MFDYRERIQDINLSVMFDYRELIQDVNLSVMFDYRECMQDVNLSVMFDYRERRRRHDMTYKFQMLQDMLYPNAEKMAKQFVLDAVSNHGGTDICKSACYIHVQHIAVRYLILRSCGCNSVLVCAI
jgi:hypothetical protein